MYGLTQNQFIVVIALIAGIALAAPAAAIEGEGGISIAPLNPDYIEYQRTAEEAVLTSSEDWHPSGLVPPPLDLSHIRASQSAPAVFSVQDTLPAVYDLRSQGRVSGVKNQGPYGTCWAFAALASLESTGVPTFGIRDYSEKHMVNLDGFDYAVNDGGDNLMAIAYLAGWTGPVNEEDDPYPDVWDDESPTGLMPEAHVQNVLILPDLTGENEAAMLKQAVMEHGAAFIDMYLSERHPYYNATTASYYYNGTLEADHAVTVVGWNDTYDRNLFASVPPEDGAWIIKNSWDTDFGDEGYFYLSYCDSTVGVWGMNTVFTAEDTGNYDAVYQHDPLGWVNSIGTGSETGWFAAVFTADTDEDLRAVSLYAAQYDSPYELYIYLDPADGPINTSGPVAIQTGTIGGAGYRTIPLENPVALSTGQTFSVVMKLTTPDHIYPIPVEYPIRNHSSKATAQPGEGYVRLGGVWVDLTYVFENSSPCLKAFTTATVRFQAPTITAAASSDTITPGDELQVNGTATGNPPHVQIWIFGPNYYGGYDGTLMARSVCTEADGTFECVLDHETDTLQEGQYYVVVQHPVDYTYGVMADTATGVMYGEGIANVTLTDLQASDAVAALVNALDSPGVDDIYATLNFEVVGSTPQANFTANVTAGPAPLTVRFTDTSTGDPTAWSWTFGDGAASAEQNPTHTYVLPGNYTVSLSVNGGAETCTKPGCIKVTPLLFGDANEDGEVNQADTLLVLQEIVGIREKPLAGTGRFTKTDVHANGAIEIGDALFIAQYNVGLRDPWFALSGSTTPGSPFLPGPA
ncbi:lectin like domain-containing protein [Methanoculleus sp.]|uniref:lectin like domain-containing protein n=1 Tax=Methanoculleus sp. TaxID=90427 RepID=UPI0025EB4EC6|nr:lectin like domain-containing protein [Methanoculleus sp.]